MSKSFGAVQALRGVDLSLEPGTLTAVLGPSGCGKTTLLRVVAGFERLDAGTVKVSGQLVAAGRGARGDGGTVHLPPEKRRVTVVPQEQALFPHLTVAENVGYGIRKGPDRDGVVTSMLEMAGLGGLGDRMPHELSGGQQQRVALARALAPTPSVVLLDEPFGSLDASLRAGLRADVAALLRATEATALLVTHDQEEALSMAQSVAVMHEGVIVQHAPPQDVYRQPVNLLVARFVGDANVLEGQIAAGGRVTCPLGDLDVAGGEPVPAAGAAVDVVVRPEQIHLSTPDGVAGRVDDRQYFGHDVVVRIMLAGDVPVLARLSSAEPLAPGARVAVECFEPVLVFPRNSAR